MTRENAGIWLRVSSTGQDETLQVPDTTAWCASHGYEIARTYTVHGRSAFKGNKKFDAAWAQVLADLRDGSITVLVVWKQDRIDRKLETFQMLAQVVDAGGRVEFVTQPHLNDLTTMGGRIALKMQEEIAHAESKDKSDRQRAMLDAKLAANELHGVSLFGFQIVCTQKCGKTGHECRRHGKTLVPVNAEAEAIRQATARYLAGDSLRAVAAWLDSKGIKPRYGGRWSPVSVSKVFRNESLTGRRTDRQGHTVLTHKAILDRATWDKLQAELDRKATRKGVMPSGTAMLTGVAVCGHCGGPMYRIQGGRGGRFVYYRCHGNARDTSTCKNMVPLAELDAWVDGQMRSSMGHVTGVTVVPGDGRIAEIERVERDLRNLDFDAPSFPNRQAALLAERKDLMSRPRQAAQVVEEIAPFTVGDLWFLMNPAQRREYLLGCGVTVRAVRGHYQLDGDPTRLAAKGMNLAPAWTALREMADHDAAARWSDAELA
jgi:DNA invertase Pin-like site-specific DNA recombinase